MPNLLDRMAVASGRGQDEAPPLPFPSLAAVLALVDVPEPSLFTWRAYDLVLARRPDPAGFHAYAARAHSSEGRRSVLADMLSSDEASGRARLPDGERRAAVLLLGGLPTGDPAIEVLLAVGHLERELRELRADAR